MSYLEDAAAELGKARDANDKRGELAAEMDAMKRPVQAEKIRAEMADRSMEIAEVHARLAAIEAGLPPCCHPVRPEPGQDPEE